MFFGFICLCFWLWSCLPYFAPVCHCWPELCFTMCLDYILSLFTCVVNKTFLLLHPASGLVPESRVRFGSICCPKPVYIDQLYWQILRYASYPCHVHECNSYHYTWWLLNCVLITNQMVPFLFSLKDMAFMIHDCQVTGQFSTLPQSTLNKLVPR